MRIKIESIMMADRIRKLNARIDELAQDIQRNGLISPITVMAVEGGYQLLAGLRRLRAVQPLGWTETEVTVAAPKDAEAALFIEHSVNVQREAFTFSEKMDYARLMEEIEKAKALERKSMGGKGGMNEDVDARPHLRPSTKCVQPWRGGRKFCVEVRENQKGKAEWMSNR